MGFEPTTFGLGSRHSTAELHIHELNCIYILLLVCVNSSDKESFGLIGDAVIF